MDTGILLTVLYDIIVSSSVAVIADLGGNAFYAIFNSSNIGVVGSNPGRASVLSQVDRQVRWNDLPPNV
jgi:hypothetical protein